ncbi:MAG TPA: alpha/beta hydrolase domain-containing protein [Anaeromyxobacteraceae bacterium]|nr:alpha/beta hydrolase domain-containing protein [Anaeromyxobacteraceae bacterium]
MSVQSSGPCRFVGGRASWLLVAGGSALLALTSIARAEVTGITYTTTSPMFGGATFGSVGQYQQLDGTITGEVDPEDEHNAIIQDIKLAPRNSNGKVDYAMTFSLLMPIDLSKSNHTLIYDVVNRGNKVISGTLNVGGSATAAGDGFLEQQGFILLWSGWQGDVLPGGGRQIMTVVPVAHHGDGSTVTGDVRQEYTLAAATSTVFLAGSGGTATASIPTATLDNSSATLTMRVLQDDPKVPIPHDQWAFADCSTTPFPGTPSDIHACLKGGFDTNHIYELVYTGRDPQVLGIGFAATRDLVAFLRGSAPKHWATSTLVNPLAGAVDSTIGFGVSQSGRFLRTFLDLGFNEDENGNRVFDGLDPEIASYRISLNIRFAQPTRLAGTQHTEKQFPGQESPTTWGDTYDEFSRISGGLLDRCRCNSTCPKVFNTVSSTEYWQAGMWATTEDADGDRDLHIPNNVRIYHWSSTQHGGSQPAVSPSTNPVCEQFSNLNSYTYNFRALLLRLRSWVVDGREPPHSRYASFRNGELVPASHVRFPDIPGVTFVGNFNSRQVLDRGREFNSKNDSGVMTEPPVVRFTYRELLPKVNEDGNEVDGVRSTQLRVPLGTYSGWNTRKVGYGHPDLCDLTGQYVPFAVHKADRLASGDPRLSVEERYGSKAGYVAAVKQAIQDQLDEGLLLPDDAVTILAQENARDIGLP